MRRWRALPFSLLLGLVLASCQSGIDDPGPEVPVPGGELIVAVRDLGTLDPTVAKGRGALLAVGQIFDGLTAIDPATNAVRPAVAREWSVDAAGLVWTFTLHERAYHDGSPVQASDFKFAFDRIARKRTGSDAAFQLEHVKGFRESNTLGSADELAGVVAVDARTLRIELARPFAELPEALAHPALAPLSVARYGKDTAGLGSRPLGNGPFRVVEATLEREAVLERVDAYEPTPFLERIRLIVEANADEAWRRFLREEIDVVDAPIDEFAGARGRFGAGGFTPQWSTLSFGPNLRDPKYAKPEVRRALSLAIDRDAIVTGVYGGTKDPATGVLPRGIRGYVPDACSSCVRDLPRARQLLQAAFGDGKLSLVVDHLNDPASRSVARAIGTQLQEAGVDVRLRSHAPDAYLKVLQDRTHDFAQLGWLADVPSPDGFLAQQLRTGSPNNQTGFADRTFDQLIDRARRTAGEDERLAAYREAEARALELMPMIPIVFFRNRTAAAADVRGLLVDGAGLFDAGTVWLAG